TPHRSRAPRSSSPGSGGAERSLRSAGGRVYKRRRSMEPSEKSTELKSVLGVVPSLVVAAPTFSATHVLPAKGVLAIGRAATTDLPIDDASVSRRHALLHVGATFAIEDLGSLNGTWVNEGKLAPRTPTDLRPGDVVRVGDVALFIRTPAAQAQR